MFGGKYLIFLMSVILSINTAIAKTPNSLSFPIYLVNEIGKGRYIGMITAENSTCGVLLKPNLRHLPPGNHGFHIHENLSCEKYGMAAGDHLDPAQTKMHKGPYHNGHLGDLPVLIVDSQGNAKLPTLAPKFTLKTMLGHTFVIHAGSDNYSDQPTKNGGGGDRIACGIISEH